MVANLTRSGHQAMEEIAATLRATAATYEREDRRHAHAYRKLY
jgi:hypothetical protein